MFYSFASLSGPDSRFHLIWFVYFLIVLIFYIYRSAATYRQKKITRRDVLSVSIHEIWFVSFSFFQLFIFSTNLLLYIPRGVADRQMKTKFSLYLLSQLMFGTIFIYREQIKYLSSNILIFMISLI